MLHRQPTHRDNAALRKAAEMNRVREPSPSELPPPILTAAQPPRPSLGLSGRDHTTHVIPHPAAR